MGLASNLRERNKRGMGFYSNRIEINKLNPGDHIYTWRAAFLYAHHGIYIGDRMVIHFTTKKNTEKIISHLSTASLCCCQSSSSSSSCQSCCFNEIKIQEGVILTCINCFLGRDKLYLYEYDLNMALYLMNPRGGTGSTFPSDPVETVLNRTVRLYQENNFGDYDTLMNNCEDFTVFCKSGRTTSGQIVCVAAIVVSIVIAMVTGGLAYAVWWFLYHKRRERDGVLEVNKLIIVGGSVAVIAGIFVHSVGRFLYDRIKEPNGTLEEKIQSTSPGEYSSIAYKSKLACCCLVRMP